MKLLFPLFLSLFVFFGSAMAQVPQLLNYQGRVAVGGVNFEGSGQFRFALVNADGSQTYWSNDGSSTAGSQPTGAVTLTVTKGLYSVLLGDTALANMTAVPPTVFANADVRLRVWFNDGTNGSQLLSPDQRIAAVGYALRADGVRDGGVSASMLASGAVTVASIAPGAVGSTQLGSNLTFSGTTTGTFSGTVNGSATSFSGALGGEVTGSQGATVVSSATSASTANALVRRDGAGSFGAGSLALGGTLNLPNTSGAGAGVITQNGSSLLHTFGTNNFFVGVGAGNFTLNGAGNTANGSQALRADTSGSNNTAGGSQALYSNTSGSFNTASGFQALYSNIASSANTASGYQALFANTSGTGNTATGTYALYTGTGSYNTAIGYNADVSGANPTNATAIGYNARATQSNMVRLGNSQVTVIQGQVAFTVSSDRNLKENFRPVDGREVLRKLRGFELTSWNFIGHDPKQFRHYGPMAQDFFAAFGHDEVGTFGTDTTINSGDLAGILMVATKELAVENEALKKQLADRDAKDAERETRLARLERMLGAERPVVTRAALTSTE